MPTYTIVSSTKSPLDPDEVHAGTITVSDGDVFIVDPSVDVDITLESDGGGPANFDIQFNESSVNVVKLSFESDLTANMTVADNVDISDYEIDARSADAFNLTAGDGVTMDKLTGSSSGVDTIILGNSFTATADWDLNGGDDVMTVGDDATFVNIALGSGNDSITFADRGTVNDIDAGSGQDTLIFDDDFTGNKIKGGGSADTFSLGHRANIAQLDGGGSDDTLSTMSPGQSSSSMETTNVVCFTPGTLIATDEGAKPVETLRPGDRVMTLDNGLQPLRWIGSMTVDATTLARSPRLRPIRIAAGALGSGTPEHDLVVSPQHRLLVRSRIAYRMFGATEILVPACKLLRLPGVSRDQSCTRVTYLHVVFDRHEIIWANGAPAESLLIGAEALRNLPEAARTELLALVPWRLLDGEGDAPARPSPEMGRRVNRFVSRHLANTKPVYLH